jgi:hypothetical protein
MIRARSREPGAAGGECDQDARNGTQGQAAARGQRALSWYAGHGGDGSGIAKRREGFWFREQRAESRDQKSEIREETSNGESPIAEDPAKGKERRAERPITSSARRVNGDR